ncbi:MAG: hypothetical protein QME32_02075 [Endomicrobiia bacterium]|nr:hypothetical protein [Endomicrobiia bacterium]
MESLEKEFREAVSSGENILKGLSKKFFRAVDVLKGDIIYGARLGSLKLKEQSLNRAKARVLYAIGKIIFKQYLKGEVKDENLVKLCEHYKKLEEIARKYYGAENKLKKKITSPI